MAEAGQRGAEKTPNEHEAAFERNGERVKELRYQYVQRIMELEAREPPHSFIYIDEAGFNLTKRRRLGRNIIGHRDTVDVPGQQGGNITMGAARMRMVCYISFYHSNIVRQWFAAHNRMLMEFL
ncbi:hypothetical protein H4Q32_014532 [Labeo rohita]|uniref:Tc1-like transposase DDE domain-containing protein n=1 Tax=Labeo rohita TaxID=84645 RepID=A0ABQ8LNH4_LABRO|nr:hypothetical protein H4Q32_014532 [Labeo rohita]